MINGSDCLHQEEQKGALPEEGFQEAAVGRAEHLTPLGRHLEGARISAGEQRPLSLAEIREVAGGEGGVGIGAVAIGQLLIEAQGNQKAIGGRFPLPVVASGHLEVGKSSQGLALAWSVVGDLAQRRSRGFRLLAG